MELKEDVFKNGIIASISKTESVKNKLLSEHKNVLFIEDSQITLLPINYCFEKTNDQLCCLEEYDVVELYSESRFYVCFSALSDDNTLFITNKCNSNCIMCPNSESQRSKNNSRDKDRLLELISYIPSDAKHITITGGEPTLMHNDLITVMSAVKNHFEDFTQFLFLTNGRTFSNVGYLEKLLAVCPENIRFAIPIYGDNSDDHDYITGAKGSFAQADAGIKNLLRNNIDVEIRIVVSKLNYVKMTDIARYIKDNYKGVRMINIMATEMTGAAAKNRQEVWIDYADAFKASKSAIKELIVDGYNVNLYNFPLCKVDEGFWSICKKSISGNKVSYNDKCDCCSVKNICGGVFNSTRILTKMELKPIKERNL